MDAKEYIIEKLNLLCGEIPNVCIRYEHDSESHSHIIEITPRDIYENDKNYISWESDMYDEFIAKYPFENICFISDDALVGLNQVTFEIGNMPTTNDRNIIHNAIVSINTEDSKNKALFPTPTGPETPCL